MGEAIIYRGEVSGFKTEAEFEEFETLVSEFGEEHDIDYSGEIKPETNVEVRIDRWRGGGNSCQKLLKNHFGSFFELHPHLKHNWTAEYVEQAPCEHEWGN